MRIEGFLPYRLAVVAEALSRQLGAVYGGEHGLTREEWRLLFLIEDAGRIDSLQLAGRTCLLYTSPSPRDRTRSRMPSSA